PPRHRAPRAPPRRADRARARRAAPAAPARAAAAAATGAAASILANAAEAIGKPNHARYGARRRDGAARAKRLDARQALPLNVDEHVHVTRARARIRIRARSIACEVFDRSLAHAANRAASSPRSASP